MTVFLLLSISGGEFQKVRLARALCQNPAFLLLDEPASNLDFVYEPSLLKVLKELAEKKNIGVILSMHDVNLAARFAMGTECGGAARRED